MTGQREQEVTQILAELGQAEGRASAELLPLVYDELRRLADAYLRRERVNHTLQTTALVHEAYVRLAEGGDRRWNDRAHFFRVAAKTMRRILINHAMEKKARKRGGGAQGVELDEAHAVTPETNVDLIALDEALQRLASVDEQKARVVELRYFGGCTIDETAAALNIGTATVEREWRTARAWLKAELAGQIESQAD